MWTAAFKSYEGSETVGTVHAIYNKGMASEFVFQATVNLDDARGVVDFLLKAKAAFIASKAPVSNAVSLKLASIITKLNI